MKPFTHHIKNERYGVVFKFRTIEDRDRYLHDKYTSKGFEPCTESEAINYMMANDFVWATPTMFYQGTLDGLEFMYSCPKVFAGVYE